MNSKYLVKKLLIYLILFSVVLSIFGLSLFFYKKTHFNESFLNLLEQSNFKRPLNSDPCANAIAGDPNGIGKHYIKVDFHCGSDKHAFNTLSVGAISGKTYTNALKILGKINGFKVNLNGKVTFGELKEKNWNCILDTKELNLDQLIRDQAWIDCFYDFTDQERRHYIETHQ